jgi:hypothetical protein
MVPACRRAPAVQTRRLQSLRARCSTVYGGFRGNFQALRAGVERGASGVVLGCARPQSGHDARLAALCGALQQQANKQWCRCEVGQHRRGPNYTSHAAASNAAGGPSSSHRVVHALCWASASLHAAASRVNAVHARCFPHQGKNWLPFYAPVVKGDELAVCLGRRCNAIADLSAAGLSGSTVERWQRQVSHRLDVQPSTCIATRDLDRAGVGDAAAASATQPLQRRRCGNLSACILPRHALWI